MYIILSVFVLVALFAYFFLIYRLSVAVRDQELAFWVSTGRQGFYRGVQTVLLIKYVLLRNFLPETFRKNNSSLPLAVWLVLVLNMIIYVVIFGLAAAGVGGRET